MRGWGLFLGAAVGITAIDLFTKAWAFARVAPRPARFDGETWQIPPHEPILLLPGMLGLKLTTNTGAVFGLGEGGQSLFIAVTFGALGLIGYAFWESRRTDWANHLALGLLMAGALGNLYDRLRFGAVRDFLWLVPGTGLWPWIFNVADAALVTGVGLLLVMSLWPEPRERG